MLIALTVYIQRGFYYFPNCYYCHYCLFDYNIAKMMEYMIIEGRRKDTQIYCVRDRIDQKKSTIKLGIRLRCVKHEICPGEAYICNDLRKVI